MNEVIKELFERKSVRVYSDKMIEEDKKQLEDLQNAAKETASKLEGAQAQLQIAQKQLTQAKGHLKLFTNSSELLVDAQALVASAKTELEEKKVEFETVPKLYGNEMGKLIKGISDNYIIAGERKVLATVFIPEINDYVTREMYVPDIQFAIDDATQTDIRYDSSKITFIAY